MREIGAGPNEETLKPNEIFKYIVSPDLQYTLIALYSPYDKCEGCVFAEDSGHPLSSEGCVDIGLYCSKRVFKSIDDVLENL